MLQFRLHRLDVDSPSWSWGVDRWRSGQSWIRPFDHPALVTGTAQGTDGARVVWVCERDAAADELHRTSAEALLNRLTATGAEFLVAVLSRGCVTLVAGPHGTAPVYLHAGADTLHGSWDVMDLRQWCRDDDLLDRAVARALTRRHRYGSDTLFGSVRRLTERATARWTGKQITVAYPPPAEHVAVARELRPGLDAVDAFERLLTSAIDRRSTEASAVELSGGVDSANVALSLAGHGGAGVASLGLLMDGLVGRDQAERRDSLIAHCGLRDIIVAAREYPPLGEMGMRPRDPGGDFYVEAFGALARAGAGNGIRVLLTGMGGDELMALRPSEDRSPRRQPPAVPWLGLRTLAALPEIEDNTAPVSPVPLATLVALAVRNPTYLREGIWPVSPLADPALVRFAESLPVSWRAGKALLKERLRRAGLPPEVVQPRRPENFLALMHSGLRRYGLPLARGMLRGSLLIDNGYVDGGALRRALHKAEIPDVLYDTVALEFGLRTLREAAHGAGDGESALSAARSL